MGHVGSAQRFVFGYPDCAAAVFRQSGDGRFDDAHSRGRDVGGTDADRRNRARRGGGAATFRRSGDDVLRQRAAVVDRIGAAPGAGWRRALVHAHRASTVSTATAGLLRHEFPAAR